jgi:alpha-galactosidase
MRAVAMVFALDDVRGPLRMFRHGYQSWSFSDVATFGVDVDPSTLADFEFFQATHHADQRTVTDPRELRSEWVTALADDSEERIVIGFEGGGEHDGTFRLRDGELIVEAFLGDALIAEDETRVLHSFTITTTTDVDGALGDWATRVGLASDARVEAPYQVGWCSWYHYFHGVTEEALLANLALARKFPFEVFQLDDGYQAAIGNWLETNEKFPSGLAAIASAIWDAGYRPGIWIAPFLVAPDAPVALEHPEWLAKFRDDRPLRVMWNPAWGGGQRGAMYGLDTTNPEVLAHLEHVARTLVAHGFTYIKLDFTFAPSHDGIWHDPTKTPAQRVRAGFDAIRRGAGDDAFLLGCGAPLSHVVGVVDGNRIGPDVAPLWDLPPEREGIKGYLRTQPATRFAYDATIARSFMHRRLWLNDPDCLMLRTAETDLAPADAAKWAHTVALSGGMALVSDYLALLDDQACRVLIETMELGRESDEATKAGECPLTPNIFRT